MYFVLRPVRTVGTAVPRCANIAAQFSDAVPNSGTIFLIIWANLISAFKFYLFLKRLDPAHCDTCKTATTASQTSGTSTCMIIRFRQR